MFAHNENKLKLIFLYLLTYIIEDFKLFFSYFKWVIYCPEKKGPNCDNYEYSDIVAIKSTFPWKKKNIISYNYFR